MHMPYQFLHNTSWSILGEWFQLNVLSFIESISTPNVAITYRKCRYRSHRVSPLNVINPDSIINHWKMWQWFENAIKERTQIAVFVWPTWGPPGSCRPQVRLILALWTLLLGYITDSAHELLSWDCSDEFHETHSIIGAFRKQTITRVDVDPVLWLGHSELNQTGLLCYTNCKYISQLISVVTNIFFLMGPLQT